MKFKIGQTVEPRRGSKCLIVEAGSPMMLFKNTKFVRNMNCKHYDTCLSFMWKLKNEVQTYSCYPCQHLDRATHATYRAWLKTRMQRKQASPDT